MARVPLQSIPIYADFDGECASSDKEWKKPSDNKNLRSDFKPKSTHPSVNKGRKTVAPSGSQPLPFMIYEDSPAQPPATVIKKKLGNRTRNQPPVEINELNTTPKTAIKRTHKDTSTKIANSPAKKERKVDAVDWKNLAEERRLALEETLKENEMLYKMLDALKREKEALEKVAANAEFLANVVEELSHRERAEITHRGTQTD